MISADQVAAAVNELLLGELQVTRGRAGARQVAASFSQAQAVVAAAVLMDPESLYRLVWKGKNRVRAQAALAKDAIDSILEAAGYLGRPYQKISSVSDLIVAQAALLELSTALTSSLSGTDAALDRTLGFLNRFASEQLRGNLVRGSSASPTSAEATALIAENWALFLKAVESLSDAADSVVASPDVISSLSVPPKAASDIAGRVQALLTELTATLSGSTQAASSTKSMIRLMAAKTILEKVARYSPPKAVRGVMTATPAGTPTTSITVSGGPWYYARGATLTVDSSGTVITIPLPNTVPVLRARNGGLPNVGHRIMLYAEYENYSVDLVVGSGDVVSEAAFLTNFNAIEPRIQAAFSDGYLEFHYVPDSNMNAGAELTLYGSPSSAGSDLFAGWFWAVTPSSAPAQSVAYATPLLSSDLAALLQAYGLTAEYTSSSSSVTTRGYSTLGAAFAAVLGSGTCTSTGSAAVAGARSPHLKVGNVVMLGTLEAYRITSSDGLNFVTSPPIPAGDYTYNVGVDLEALLPVGTLFRAEDRWIRTLVPPLGFEFYWAGTSTENAALRTLTKYTQTVTISLEGSGSYLQFSGTGAAALGLPSAPQRPQINVLSTTSTLPQLDDVFMGSRVVELAPLTLSPAVPYAPAYEGAVLNGRYQDLAALAASLGAALPPVLDVALGGTMEAVLRGGRLSASSTAALVSVSAGLDSMILACDSYAVSSYPTVDYVLQMLEELGMDRARELLLRLYIIDFFSCTQETATFSGWISAQLSSATRQVAPVSKFATGEFGYRNARIMAFLKNPTRSP